MSTGYTPGAGYYQSPHSYQGKPMTTFTSPASPHHGVPSGMVSNTSISPGPSAHYAPQYGLSVQSIVDPTTGRGITALSQVNPTLRSPHHTLVQDKETGVIDNTVAGISSQGRGCAARALPGDRRPAAAAGGLYDERGQQRAPHAVPVAQAQVRVHVELVRE